MVEGDIAWSERTLFLPLIAFLVGITCTLIHIGGGELMSPLEYYPQYHRRILH
jgi:hypothetical protein